MRKTMFFSSEKKWEEKNPDKASKRLEVIHEERIITENTLYEKRSDGSWERRNLQDLQGEEAGFSWQYWPTQIKNKQFLVFKGVRSIDNSINTIFNNLTIYNRKGQEIKPQEAGDFFLLTEEDAKNFAKRLQKIKGKIIKGEPEHFNHQKEIEKLDSSIVYLENLLSKDYQNLQEAEAADFSTQIEFEEREEEWLQALEKIRNFAFKKTKTIEEEMTYVSQEEKKVLRKMLENLYFKKEQAELLFQNRQENEIKMARFLAKSSSESTTLEPSRALQNFLFQELGHLWQEKGLYVQTEIDHVKIYTHWGWLRIDAFGVTELEEENADKTQEDDSEELKFE